jgi:hypothetical protein
MFMTIRLNGVARPHPDSFDTLAEFFAAFAEWRVIQVSQLNHSQLISELSIPKIIRLELGKIKVESKDQLRARGVKSPDFADALVLSEVGNVDPVKVTPLGRTDSPLIGMPRNAIEQSSLDDDDLRSTWESPDYLGMKF